MRLVVEEGAGEADGAVARLAVILDGFSAVNATVVLAVVVLRSRGDRQHRVSLSYLKTRRSVILEAPRVYCQLFHPTVHACEGFLDQ